MFETQRIEAIAEISDHVTKGSAAADYVRKVLNGALSIKLVDVSSDPASADLYDSINHIRVEVKCKSSELKHSLDEKFCRDIRRFKQKDKLFIYVNLQQDKLSFRTNHLAFIYGMNPNVNAFLQELKASIDFERESMKYKRSSAVKNTITDIECELDEASAEEAFAEEEKIDSSSLELEEEKEEPIAIPISTRYTSRVPFPATGITREHYDEIMDRIIHIPLSDDETIRGQQRAIENSIICHFEDILGWKIGLTEFRHGYTEISSDLIKADDLEKLLLQYDIHRNHGGKRMLRFKKWFRMNNKKASVPARNLKPVTVEQQNALLELNIDELQDIELIKSEEKGSAALLTIGYVNVLRIFKKYAIMREGAIPTKDDVYLVPELDNTIVDVRACYGSIRQHDQYYGLKQIIDTLIPETDRKGSLQILPNERNYEYIARLIKYAAINHLHFYEINGSTRESKQLFNLHRTLMKSRSTTDGLAKEVHEHRHEIRTLIAPHIQTISREGLACKFVEGTETARSRTEDAMKAFIG